MKSYYQTQAELKLATAKVLATLRERPLAKVGKPKLELANRHKLAKWSPLQLSRRDLIAKLIDPGYEGTGS